MNDEPLTLDQFLDRLDVGEYDDHLQEIRARTEERRAVLVHRKARSLKEGDTVVFTNQASPKYLRGLTATYIGPGPRKKDNPTAIVATPDDSRYKRFGGCKVTSPVNTIEKVDP